jgi:predicted transcriptional regulator
MKTNPVTTSPDKTVNDARWLFRTHRIGGLPVLENGEFVGMFTLADLKKTRRGTTRFGDVMTRNPIVALEDEKLGEVFDKMADHRIGRIPVVSKDGQLLVGLVSLSDIKNLSRMHALKDTTSSSPKALICQSCHGPLGIPTSSFVKCGYCGVVNQV